MIRDIHENILPLCVEALSNAALFSEICSNSTSHPLGFSKISFGSMRGLANYRIHIWDTTSEQTPNGSIHSHQWGFDAYVVCGSVQHFYFVVDPLRGTNYSKFMYDPSHATLSGPTSLSYCGPSKLYLYKEFSLQTGEHVHIKSDILHRASAKPGTITIIKKGDRNDSLVEVYFQKKRTRCSSKESPLSKSELAVALRTINSKLNLHSNESGAQNTQRPCV